MNRLPRYTAAILLALAALAWPAMAQDLAQFEENLTVATLDNGLTLLVYERPTAPVVSFATHVDVGSAQEVPGITGLAHMFEHMAFKGTSEIGTTNAKAEAKALAVEDRAYAAYMAEQYKIDADPEKVEALKAAFIEARDAAEEFVANNEFTEIVEREGGVGVNAGTGADLTVYMMSMPANKVELWAYLESSRFLDPVFREFYQERDVVQEERRMRTESQPVGRLIEQLITVAFQAHPYGQPTVGHMSDLQSFTREDAKAFYEVYYVPSNITVAVVGDVEAKKVMPMLKRYFSRLPAGDAPPHLRTEEPPQIAEKSISLPDASQPIYIEGYKRPASTDSDDAVYDAMASVLATGRTSRLYRSLIRDQQIAAFSTAFNGFPGSKYPHLMLFLAATTPEHTNEEVQAAIRAELDKLMTEPVSDEELDMVKTQAKANLIRGLASNGGIAQQLAIYQGQLGDWRELFRNVERIEKVSAEDIMRVAQATFKPTNRTVAMIVNEDEASEAEGE